MMIQSWKYLIASCSGFVGHVTVPIFGSPESVWRMIPSYAVLPHCPSVKDPALLPPIDSDCAAGIRTNKCSDCL